MADRPDPKRSMRLLSERKPAPRAASGEDPPAKLARIVSERSIFEPAAATRGKTVPVTGTTSLEVALPNDLEFELPQRPQRIPLGPQRIPLVYLFLTAATAACIGTSAAPGETRGPGSEGGGRAGLTKGATQRNRRATRARTGCCTGSAECPTSGPHRKSGSEGRAATGCERVKRRPGKGGEAGVRRRAAAPDDRSASIRRGSSRDQAERPAGAHGCTASSRTACPSGAGPTRAAGTCGGPHPAEGRGAAVCRGRRVAEAGTGWRRDRRAQ